MSAVRRTVRPMPSRRLSPRTMLDVALSAAISRSLLTRDPDPVIAELRALAGDDVELLAQVAGGCAGWYEAPQTAVMCAALVDQIAGAASWAQAARERRSQSVHGAPRRDVDRPGKAGGAGEVEP